MGARGSPVLYSGERAGRVLDGEPKSLMKQRRDERRQKRKNTHAFQEDELVNLLTGEGPELPKPTPESEPSDDTSKVFQVKAQMLSFKQASGCTQESLGSGVRSQAEALSSEVLLGQRRPGGVALLEAPELDLAISLVPKYLDLGIL